MLRKVDVVRAICKKIHYTRKDPNKQDLSKKELLQVSAFLDVVIQQATQKIQKSREA